MLLLLLCGLSAVLPRASPADGCKKLGSVHNETSFINQPVAFNCTYSLLTSGNVHITWYKYPNKIPVSKNIQSRIHQDQTWILFLSVAMEDAGIYYCVINDTDVCHRKLVNLTVLHKHSCNVSGNTEVNLSYWYKQILHIGEDGILKCHLDFPRSWVLDSMKWFKDCKEIKGMRFTKLRKELTVNNISTDDRGNYSCLASLKHEGKNYTVLKRITVVINKANPRRIVPKIIYPNNNSIEVKPGSALTVNCSITDVKGNTNARSWKINGTLVNTYYNESQRIKEGFEKCYSISEDYNFYIVNITFIEVKMEDYGQAFMCHAGVPVAYIVLNLPAPDFRVHLIVGLLILTGMAVSVGYIYTNFKIDIVLWYRSAFLSARIIEDGKLYDAYVLYPKAQRESHRQDVATLVLKILPDVLERQCGYKLFIFGRDEFPGQAVANVIDENIKLCRRLIIILPKSLSFVMKNMSEEQIAIYNALVQDGMKVILIELEKIKDYTVMPESIQYIRQKHGSLLWSGDFTEKIQCAKTTFWKKVRYHMPPRRYPPPSSSIQLLTYLPCDLTAG